MLFYSSCVLNGSSHFSNDTLKLDEAVLLAIRTSLFGRGGLVIMASPIPPHVQLARLKILTSN